MGYTTDFSGQFDLNKKLDSETHEFLKKLAETRRMKRNVGPEYGVEGEFYVEGKGFMGQDDEDNVVNSNCPPSTQPGLWLQWIPSEDGMHIEWDGGEKFYYYEEWLVYIIDKILKPRGYILNGAVDWRGEEMDDIGCLIVEDNVVRTGPFGSAPVASPVIQSGVQTAEEMPAAADPEPAEEPEVLGKRKIVLDD